MPDQQAQDKQQTSSFAQISLITGIASFFILSFLGAIAAIITGYLARKEIQQSNDLLAGEDLARWGLILGWINIGLSIFGIFCLGLIVLFGIITFPIWFVPSLTIFNLLLTMLGGF